MEYIQRYDGESWTEKNKVPFQIRCCDCGLVHSFVVSFPNLPKHRQFSITAELRGQATAGSRRSKELRKVARAIYG